MAHSVPSVLPLVLLLFSHISGHKTVKSKGLEKAVLCCREIAFSSSCCCQRKCLKARMGLIGKKRTFESHGSLQGLLSSEDIPVTVQANDSLKPTAQMYLPSLSLQVVFEFMGTQRLLCWVWVSSVAGTGDRLIIAAALEMQQWALWYRWGGWLWALLESLRNCRQIANSLLSASTAKTRGDSMSQKMMGNEVYERRNKSGPDSSLHPFPSREEDWKLKAGPPPLSPPTPCSENTSGSISKSLCC